MELICKICQNTSGNRLHIAREMAFGLCKKFRYLECGACGCLQLWTIPRDMKTYYPPGYYSLQPHSAVKAWSRCNWSAHACGRTNLVVRVVSYSFFSHGPRLAVRRVDAPKTAGILDVGCGRGYLLEDLARSGFRHLTGAGLLWNRIWYNESGVKGVQKIDC